LTQGSEQTASEQHHYRILLTKNQLILKEDAHNKSIIAMCKVENMITVIYATCRGMLGLFGCLGVIRQVGQSTNRTKAKISQCIEFDCIVYGNNQYISKVFA